MVFFLASCGSGTTESASETGTGNGSDIADVAEPNTGADPDQSDSVPSDSVPSDSVKSAGALGDFPSVDVANVMTGETLNLQQELSGGDTPILLWFYAPH